MSVRRRWSRILLPVIVLLAVLVGLPVSRVSILRAAGWALVVDEPVQPATVIVVPAWAGPAGALDAADLVHSGIASRVALLSEPPEPADEELARRGIPYVDENAKLAQLLRVLGVANVETIPEPAAGTEAEGQVLLSWCDLHQFRSIIVVATPDHSRRVRRVLRRSMLGHEAKVMIRSARYSSFDPDQWWMTREGTRTGIIELEKLLFDVIRHPIS